MQQCVIGVDVGTSAIKGILCDADGVELATAHQGYPLATPQPGWVEEDPEDVWAAILAVLTALARAAGPERAIAGLALSTQGGSVIPCAANGAPVYPMITWLDSRSGELMAGWKAIPGREERIRQLSGWHLHPGLPFSNIAWLRQQRPHIFAATDRFMAVNDHYIWRLTGRFCNDLSNGAQMQLVDLSTERWSAELCVLVGIAPSSLSELLPSGAVVGPILPQVAALTGLSPETLVVMGGQDHCCEALAMGMMNTGRVMLATGTAWVITGVAESPNVAAIPPVMDLNYHVLPRRWTVSQLLGGYGATMEWWLGEHWAGLDQETPRRAGYAALNAALMESTPGCKGLLFAPLDGSSQSATAVPGGFRGLRLDHTRADMARAILESAAFEVRWALENLRDAGLPTDDLWVAGGATQSPVWPQILADVTGAPIAITNYAYWSALGGAMLAGVGVGLFASSQAAIAALQKPVQTLAPDPAFGSLYTARFAAYLQMHRGS